MSLNTLFDNGTHKIESAGVTSNSVLKTITKLAFKQRFTQPERTALRAEAKTNAIVEDFMDLVSDAKFIDLARQDTIDSVNFLESSSLIATGRANEILNSPIQGHELS